MLPAVLLGGYFFNSSSSRVLYLRTQSTGDANEVVGGSIAQVFFPQAAEARRNGNLDRLTLDMFQRRCYQLDLCQFY